MKRALAVSLALLCASPAAFAQNPSERERAKASFKAGANAYAAGDYLAAIQALEAAYQLTPLPAIAFSLAQAERKQYAVTKQRSHLERAVELFQIYVQREPNGARVADASLALAELRPQLAAPPSPAPPLPTPQTESPERPTRVMIVADVPGARVALDGHVVGPTPLIREVSPGKHRARVSAPGYLDVERDVTAVAGELILSEVRLPERPTFLYVWAPDGSDIYVDGVYVTPGGPLATIPLATGVHQLAVSKPGKVLVRRDFRLQRGQTHTEYVTLEDTTQRTLSRALFIGSGVALGAGVVLSAFAIRSENKAEDFLNSRDPDVHGSVRPDRFATSPADLAAYNAALSERVRFRTAAAIGIASSVGMFITGLFLHEMDRPNVSAPPRRDRDSNRDSARFSIEPAVGTGDPGASLLLHF